MVLNRQAVKSIAPKKDRHSKSLLQLCILAALLLLVIVISTSMGYLPIPFLSVVKIIVAQVFGNADFIAGLDERFLAVVVDIRLPRILAAAIVGAGLAVAGVVFQGILLNPLADPYTLGVSAGAAFGAAIAILLNIGFIGGFNVPVFAFAGALVTLFAVIYLSSSGDGGSHTLSSNNLILSGIIVAAILSAGISFLKYIADENVAVIIFWLMGSFASMTWSKVLLTFIIICLGSGVAIFFARDLNLMSQGNRAAASLGVDTRRVTLILLITASMVAAVCVSISGIIGFVGLLVPHMMRSFTGPDNRKLIPVAFLSGAILLLGADTVTRAILPVEVPIGVLTALIGGPFFCYIFRKRQISGGGM